MTETAVGASTWASGNQVWNGKIGTLIAKPMNSADPDACAGCSVSCSQALWLAWSIMCSMLKVWPPVTGSLHVQVEGDHRQQHQHRAGQRVEEELDRRVLACRGPPQMPIRKYIGSSITSQNT